MASFRAVRRALCTAAEAAPAPAPAPVPAGRWERLKQSKAGLWCRSLLSDYKEACREVVVGARDRPLKASVYVGLLGGAYACFSTKPDQSSFQAALLDRSNQLALLSPWIRNATSDLHVQNLVTLRNQGRLHHLSLGFVSLVYSADFDPQSALYEATCSNLSVPWRELPQRVLDVGFAGRWWVLDKKMEDFDVNEAEYKHLPVHMQATAPPSVQEVERNEKLHKDSWLPIVQEEETLPPVVQEKEETLTPVQEEETLPPVVLEEEETLPPVVQEEEETLPPVVQEEEETLPPVVQEEEETLPPVVQEEETLEEDVKADTAEEASVNVQVVDTIEMPDIKEEVKQEDIMEDSLVLQTLDTKEETQVGQTLDTSELETMEVKEEAEEKRGDTEEDIHVVKMVDTVTMETVDIQEDSMDQKAAQSMKN